MFAERSIPMSKKHLYRKVERERDNNAVFPESPLALHPLNKLKSTRSAITDMLTAHQTFGNSSVIRYLQRVLLTTSSTNVIQTDPTGNSSRNSTLDMDPLRITGNRGGGVEKNVPNLDQLRGQGQDPNGIEMSYEEADVERNSPDSSQLLPFTKTGWNANEIMTRLGQYDTLQGTDSDSKRCVQAVAMASQIPSGPNAVVKYLSSMILTGFLAGNLGTRQRTAIRVLELVQNRINSRRATYGDLSWAQEALHDLFFNDVSGTPGPDIIKQIAPTFDGISRNTETKNIWCTKPADVMAQANKLPPGGQLIITTWKVILNAVFDQLEEQGVQTRDRMQVRVNNRLVWIKRIPSNRRPNPQDIQEFRDSRKGHQLLLIKDNDQAGTIRLYEPEITKSGQHLLTISETGAELMPYLTENPEYGIYDYVQILGMITPSQNSPFVVK